MDQYPIQGDSKTLVHLTLQKLEISAGSMGHLVRKGFSFHNGVKIKKKNKKPSASIMNYLMPHPYFKQFFF